MNTHNIPFQYKKKKKKITINYPKSAVMGFCSKRLKKNEFETAVVNEPLVFVPLKFYCISRFEIFRRRFSLFRCNVKQINSNRKKKKKSYMYCIEIMKTLHVLHIFTDLLVWNCACCG